MTLWNAYCCRLLTNCWSWLRRETTGLSICWWRIFTVVHTHLLVYLVRLSLVVLAKLLAHPKTVLVSIPNRLDQFIMSTKRSGKGAYYVFSISSYYRYYSLLQSSLPVFMHEDYSQILMELDMNDDGHTFLSTLQYWLRFCLIYLFV